MKVAVCAADEALDSEVDSRFGRCKYFIIVNSETMDAHAVPNTGGRTGEGAGIQAAQTLINEGVEAVIGVNLGPNAFMALKYAGIKLYNGKGTVSEVINQFRAGKLHEIESSTVPKKAGQFQR